MILEMTVPLGVLGFVQTALPIRASIKFERTASVFGTCSSSIVVSGADTELVRTIRESRFIKGTTLVGKDEHSVTYRLTWDETLPELIECIREADGTVLSAVAVDNTWTFNLRFPEQRAASRFYTRYSDSEYPLEIQRVSEDSVTQRSQNTVVTKKQQEVPLHALQVGYFEVPRQATTDDLALEFDISDTAVSERLRRGVAAILRETTHSTIDVAPTALGDD